MLKRGFAQSRKDSQRRKEFYLAVEVVDPRSKIDSDTSSVELSDAPQSATATIAEMATATRTTAPDVTFMSSAPMLMAPPRINPRKTNPKNANDVATKVPMPKPIEPKMAAQASLRMSLPHATSSWRVRRYLIRSRNSAARSNSYFAAAALICPSSRLIV